MANKLTSSENDAKSVDQILLVDDNTTNLQLLRDTLDGCIGCGCLSLDACALYNADDRAAQRGTGPRYLMGDSPD